jgi:hypothetical protein
MIPEKRDAGRCLAKREKTKKGKDAGSKLRPERLNRYPKKMKTWHGL